MSESLLVTSTDCPVAETWWHGSVGRAKQSYFATNRRAKSLGFKVSPSSRRTKFPGKHSWWHGSVGRAHRSHRWGRWFESNCHHSLPSSGGFFSPFFHFRACLPQKPVSSESRSNPLFDNLLRPTRPAHKPTVRQYGSGVQFNQEYRFIIGY